MNCEVCNHKIKKVRTFKDIFLIKAGKEVVCDSCSTVYQVKKPFSTLGKFYNHIFWGGGFFFVWLLGAVAIDKYIYDDFGIWVWAIFALVYIAFEMILALYVPVHKKV